MAEPTRPTFASVWLMQSMAACPGVRLRRISRSWGVQRDPMGGAVACDRRCNAQAPRRKIGWSMAIEAQAAFILSLLGPHRRRHACRDAWRLARRRPFVQHLCAFALLRPKGASRSKKESAPRDRARSARYPEAPSGLRWRIHQLRSLIRRSSFSSTRPGPPRTWRDAAVALATRPNGCVAAVPHGHWKTATFVAALRHRPTSRRRSPVRRADQRRALF